MAGPDFHSRTNQLVAPKFLQRRAHVSEAIGEKERGREQERKKKEFHGLSDNAFVERFKAKRDGKHRVPLEFGYWSFSGAWMLELGAFSSNEDGRQNFEAAAYCLGGNLRFAQDSGIQSGSIQHLNSYDD